MQHKFQFLLIVILLVGLVIAPTGRANALTNLIQDPSLEAAIASTVIWKQNSSNADTPLCTLSIPECNFGSGVTLPHTGSVWALFGGIDFSDPEAISPEISGLYQNVTFPTCGALLQFYFWIGAAPAGSDTLDVFRVRIDGTPVFGADATQQSSYSAYTLVSVDVSAYADGAVHKVEFFSSITGQTVIFNLDDVSLVRNCLAISGNAGVAGATLNYTGGSTVADGSGNYSFDVPSGWSGTVTPSKTGYTFSPPSKTYANILVDQTGQDYVATALYSISGNVGVGGVTLGYTVNSVPLTATSNLFGDYAFSVPANWTGTVTPTHACFTFAPTFLSYGSVSADQPGQDYTATPVTAPGCSAYINVLMGGDNQGIFGMPDQGSVLSVPFTGINTGPVKMESSASILGAERVNYKVNGKQTSFSELIGLPNSQLDTTYWLPWYKNIGLDTQLRLGNVSNSTATVHVTIGGAEMTGSPFIVAQGQSALLKFASIDAGPVKIVSDVPIVASERMIYKVNGVNTSFSEMLALPNSQLDNTYWLPWYNNMTMNTQLRIANVSASTAKVRVYIGGTEMTGSPFNVAIGKTKKISFAGINKGPVKIVSNVDILASERVIFKVNEVNTSFSEMMALPNGQLDTTHWLPWYDNVSMNTQLRIGNAGASAATVHVYIEGVEIAGSPFIVAKGKSKAVSFVGVQNGLVKIVSDVAIVVSERVIPKLNGKGISFSELLALPNSQVDTIYWLPWYDNVALDTQLRLGAP